MAALNFPINPQDGQLYPDPPIPGNQQYVYSEAKGTWLTVFQGLGGVTASSPIYLTGSAQVPDINIYPATPFRAGSLSAADKAKLDSLSPSSGTVTKIVAGVGIGMPFGNDEITVEGTVNLLPANFARIGGVRPGVGCTVNTEGTLNLAPPSGVNIGGVKAGTGVTIGSDGTLSIATGATYKVLDNISTLFNGVSTTFQLRIRNAAVAPASPNALMIFVGGVFQIPNIAFTVAGSNITFTSAPPSNATFYGLLLT